MGSSATFQAPGTFNGCAVNLGNPGRPEEPVCTTTGLTLCLPWALLILSSQSVGGSTRGVVGSAGYWSHVNDKACALFPLKCRQVSSLFKHFHISKKSAILMLPGRTSCRSEGSLSKPPKTRDVLTLLYLSLHPPFPGTGPLPPPYTLIKICVHFCTGTHFRYE